MKKFQLSSVTSPSIEFECAGVVVQSEVIKDTKKNPNFEKPVLTRMIVVIRTTYWRPLLKISDSIAHTLRSYPVPSRTWWRSHFWEQPQALCRWKFWLSSLYLRIEYNIYLSETEFTEIELHKMSFCLLEESPHGGNLHASSEHSCPWQQDIWTATNRGGPFNENCTKVPLRNTESHRGRWRPPTKR